MVLQMLQMISFGYSLFWIKLDVKRVSRFYIVIIFVQVIFNANPRFHAWTKHMKWIIFCMRSSFKAILENRFVSTKYQIANLRENCFIVRALLDKQWGREAWSLILRSCIASIIMSLGVIYIRQWGWYLELFDCLHVSSKPYMPTNHFIRDSSCRNSDSESTRDQIDIIDIMEINIGQNQH